jgi:hypothetical protein
MRTTIGFGAMALVALTLAGISGFIGKQQQQHLFESTVRLERLATELEHANKVPPETKLEIAKLIHQPWTDCERISCRADVEIRNRAARNRLEAILAGTNSPLDLGHPRRVYLKHRLPTASVRGTATSSFKTEEIP